MKKTELDNYIMIIGFTTLAVALHKWWIVPLSIIFLNLKND